MPINLIQLKFVGSSNYSRFLSVLGYVNYKLQFIYKYVQKVVF